jgi:maltokinase
MTLPFADWLPQQRWYAGRGRTIAEVKPAAVTRLDGGLEHMLLRVAYADGGADTYQVVVAWDRPPSEEFVGISRIGDVDGRTAYDAMYAEQPSRDLLAMISAGRQFERLHFIPEPDAKVVDDTTARVIEGEQSNTSVVFSASAILKLYRRIVPGINPDLELSRALGRAGNPHVAPLMGAVEGEDDTGEPLALATVTGFASNAADGWAMAVASARDLIGDPDLRPDEAGGDFAGEAHRLGEAVASVHLTLGEEFGREVATPPVERMIQRLHDAAASVPELATYVDAATAILRRGNLPTIVQRIHGDLHLGQALRTPENWILIDFEGEPGEPMAERRQPDSPMRDIAAMLRSFDYVAHQLLIGAADDKQLGARAHEWTQRNSAAFCDGYASVTGVDPREHADLLAAYELDKACYEAAYESRHRPEWRWIPLHAVERFVSPNPPRLSGSAAESVGAAAPDSERVR